MVLSEGAVLLPVKIWTEPTIYTQDAVAGGKDFHWKIHFSFTAMRDQQKTTTGGVIWWIDERWIDIWEKRDAPGKGRGCLRGVTREGKV